MVAYVAFAAALTISACIAAVLTHARIHDGTLTFHFCGISTQSIALDAETTFEVREIGRMRTLRITRGASNYLPNGALNTQELIDLLRANGVAERKAEHPTEPAV